MQQGVVAVAMAPSGDIIVGGGDGALSIMKQDQEGQDARFLNKMPVLATTKLGSQISTLTVDHARSNARSLSLVCGTHMCEKFRVTYDIQASLPHFTAGQQIQTVHNPLHSLLIMNWFAQPGDCMLSS